MKKITIIGSCLFCTLFLTNNAQNNISNDNIVSNTNIKDYKKASDSLLQIAEKNNLEALKNLEEVKKLQDLKEKQNKEIISMRKEIKNNLQLIIDLFKQKNIENNNELIIGNEKIKIDSIYVKGSFLKKSKWVYQITFNDGTKKILD